MPTRSDALAAAIELFQAHAPRVPQFVRAFVRGTGANEDQFVPGWSDLDLSIVLRSIERDARRQLRALFALLARKFGGKVSLTVVTEADFLRYYHHHGSKPVHYTHRLQAEHYGVDAVRAPHARLDPPSALQLDALYNIAYLVHDLRARDLILSADERTLFEQVVHTCKRARHVARNGVWLRFGESGELLEPTQLAAAFPSLQPQFCERWSQGRTLLISMASSPRRAELEELQEYLMSQVEVMYEDAHGGFWPVAGSLASSAEASRA